MFSSHSMPLEQELLLSSVRHFDPKIVHLNTPHKFINIFHPADRKPRNISSLLFQRYIEYSVARTNNEEVESLIRRLDGQRRQFPSTCSSNNAPCLSLSVVVCPNISTPMMYGEDWIVIPSDNLDGHKAINTWTLRRLFPHQLIKEAVEFLGKPEDSPITHRLLKEWTQQSALQRLEARKIVRQHSWWNIAVAVLMEPFIGGVLHGSLTKAESLISQLMQLNQYRSQVPDLNSLNFSLSQGPPLSDVFRITEELHRFHSVSSQIEAQETALLQELIETRTRLAQAIDGDLAALVDGLERWKLHFVVYGPFFVPILVPICRALKAH